MKIEFDIPEFKKELKIEITIRRDGEIIHAENLVADNKVENKTASRESNAKEENPGATKNSGVKKLGKGGNMMNVDDL